MTEPEKASWPHLTTRDVAALLGCRPQTLEKWRMTGDGPPFCVVGRGSIRYSPESVQAWLASRARRSTSDPGRDNNQNQP
ncbi:MAG TPA: helix-turn-helix domain-containing protein [Candidatus Binatia bacterium]|jgi:predicted DNA-binding transcriptional regulator AlpA